MAVLETKAKEILIAVCGNDTTTYPALGMDMSYVIADTLSVTQADPTELTFRFETTSTPETIYKPGAYEVELNNAELSEQFMTEIMGWQKTTNPPGVVAPESFTAHYVSLQVKMAEDKYYFLPKISIAPKLVMESIKTNLVYGTLSGTATNALVGDKRTAFGKYSEPMLLKESPQPLPPHQDGELVLWENGSAIQWENNDYMIVEQNI